ncbi:MAG: lysylphosphatidylglycerol synthase transmembrane domain-containing protein [Gammaproteobacteria bacterium]
MSRFLRAAAPWVLGLGSGALFLWFTLAAVGSAALREAFATFDVRWIAPAAACFAGAMLLRIVRWRELLRPLAPRPLRVVAGPLLAGYALNNLLPARLGELLRAHYARGEFGLSGSAVLGTIVAERAGDLCIILALLAWGIAFGLAPGGAGREASWGVAQSGVAALLAIALLAGAVGLAVRARWLERFAHVHRRLVAFRAGLATMRAARRPRVFGAASAIWLLEGAALAAIVAGTGLTLTAPQAALVLGCVSLSTVLPSAPGFIGTLQFAFYFALELLGLDGARGVVAATLMQLALYLPATLVGIGWGLRSGLLRRGRMLENASSLYPDKRI